MSDNGVDLSDNVNLSDNYDDILKSDVDLKDEYPDLLDPFVDWEARIGRGHFVLIFQTRQ